MTGPLALLAGLYVGVLVAATWTDLRTRRIPNRLTLPALAGALIVAAATGHLASALAGAVFAGGLFVLPAVLYGAGAAGGGDVKLAAFVGAALGLSGAITALLVTGIVGALVVLVGVATSRLSRRQKVPFGPFIAVGGIVAMFAEMAPKA